MAKKKNQKQKQRQRALNKARKDGKVTKAEAKNLRSLGITTNKITATKKGTIKVGKQATKAASKPKPTPAPSPKPSPTPSPTAPARAAGARAKANAPAPTPSPSRQNNIFERS